MAGILNCLKYWYSYLSKKKWFLKIIYLYREGRKGDLKFLKNRMKTAKAAHQAIRQRHHQAWKANHEKVHKQLPGPVGVSGVDPQASTIQLWPPFSVANTVLPIQVRPSQSASGSIHPTTTMMSSVNSSMY